MRREVERTTTPLNDARRRELQALRDQVEALEEVNDLMRRAAELEDRRVARESEPEPVEEVVAPAIEKKKRVRANTTPGQGKAALLNCFKEHGGETTIGHLTKAWTEVTGDGRGLHFVLKKIATEKSPNVWTLNEEVAS